MTRDDIKGYVRDDLYESVADLVTDTQIANKINQELRSLPRRGIYLQQIWTADTVVNQQDYALPSGTYKVERVERNWGTSTVPLWEEIKGWEVYNNGLYFKYVPPMVFSMRVLLRKAFTELTAAGTVTDVPDEKVDVVIAGVLYRCLKLIMQYFLHARNWDSLAKPDGVSIPQLQAWLAQAKNDYMELVQLYRFTPKPKEIDLVG